MTNHYLSPMGDDSNDGKSPQTAWRSLSKASSAEYGLDDAILLKGGEVFEGSLTLEAGGRLTIGSYGEGRATIDAGDGFGVSVTNRVVVIENLVLRGDWDAKAQAGNTDSGVKLICDLPDGQALEGPTVRNVEASGFRGCGIVVRGGGSDGGKCGFHNVLIEGCVARDNGSAGIAMGGNMDMASNAYCHHGVVIRDCVAHHNRGVSGVGSHSGSGIVISDLQDGVIERCVAYENGENNDYVGGGPVGIWCWDCDQVAIQHCEAYGNRTSTKDGGGFDLDGGATNCVLQYNYSHENDGCGILICQFSNARPFHDNLVRYNLSVDDGQKGVGGIVVYDDGSGISDCDVIHNTIICLPHEGAETQSPLRLLTPSCNLRIFNNVFVSSGPLPLIEAVAGQTGLQMSGNVFRQLEGGAQFLWCGKEVEGLEAFKSTSGLASPGSIEDLRLPLDSPTLGLGASMDALAIYKPSRKVSGVPGLKVERDLLGQAVDPARPCVGAVEA